MHGLGGFKEQPHIQIFAKALSDNGYTTVAFDTTRSIGESDGKFEDATITTSYQDLEDVISWSAKQSWYQEPFILVGHSLGGICTSLYAENFPTKVRALIPVSSVVSGSLSLEVAPKEKIEQWEKTGWDKNVSQSKPGLLKRLKWAHMEDRLKYSLLPLANKLTMPVLLIVGEIDTTTPQLHQKILYDALPGKKSLEVIKRAPHTFRDQNHLDEVYKIIDKWVKCI